MAIDDARLARPYAEAAHRHAQAAGGGAPADWSAFLGSLAEACGREEMRAALSDPRVSREQAAAILGSLAGGMGADEPMRRFAAELLGNNRLGAAGEIAKQYEQLRREAEEVIEAEIRSAFELERSRVDEITARLAERFGKRAVSATVVIDSTLTGGLVVTAGDEVIDCSVSAQLDQLRHSLLRPQ